MEKNSINSNDNLILFLLFIILVFILMDKCKLNENLLSLSHEKKFYYIKKNNISNSKILEKINSEELKNNIIIKKNEKNQKLINTHLEIWRDHVKSKLPYILVTTNKLPYDNILNDIDKIMNVKEIGTSNIIFINKTKFKKPKNIEFDYKDILPGKYYCYNLNTNKTKQLLKDDKLDLSRSYILTLNGAKNLIHKIETMVGNKDINDFFNLHLDPQKTYILESNN